MKGKTYKVNHETENDNTLNSVDESVNERINKLGSTQDNVSESSIAVSSLDSKESKNHEELNLIEDQDNEKCNLLGSTNDKVSDNNENNSTDKQISEIIEAVKLKAVKPNLKKKRIKKADVPLKADLQDSEID